MQTETYKTAPPSLREAINTELGCIYAQCASALLQKAWKPSRVGAGMFRGSWCCWAQLKALTLSSQARSIFLLGLRLSRLRLQPLRGSQPRRRWSARSVEAQAEPSPQLQASPLGKGRLEECLAPGVSGCSLQCWKQVLRSSSSIRKFQRFSMSWSKSYDKLMERVGLCHHGEGSRLKDLALESSRFAQVLVLWP